MGILNLYLVLNFFSKEMGQVIDIFDFKWRRRADLNRRLYGFANHSIGPLWHVSSELPIMLAQILLSRISAYNYRP